MLMLVLMRDSVARAVGAVFGARAEAVIVALALYCALLVWYHPGPTPGVRCVPAQSRHSRPRRPRP